MSIDCKSISDDIKSQIKEEVSNLAVKPKLLVLRVKGDEASEIYVRNKKKVCEEVGIMCEVRTFDEDVEEETLISHIVNDVSYNGIMVQLPLPDHIDEQRVLNAIPYFKDVDGLTNENVGRLWNGDDGLFPCTSLGVTELIKRVCKPNSDVLIINRSKLVGKPLAALLLRENFTPTIAHSNSRYIPIAKNYEGIVCAIGKPNYFNHSDFYGHQFIVDVGINRTKYGICGDVDKRFLLADFTPVPGGVGLMTTAMLAKNVLKAYKMQEELCQK